MASKIFAACFVLVLLLPLTGRSQKEVIYHVFERSFYDANGDRQGDLRGLRERLDYIQQLGATSILLTPLYASAFYHNYFADDWKKIDPAYGTMQDYLALVRAIHARGMKIYLDMETQYITDRHPWWGTDKILYDDSAHTKPGPIIWGITELKGYNGAVRKVATVNLRESAVLADNERLFGYFVDPNGDGNFHDDGVDGFRLDHCMDDLDGNPRLRGLFTGFWAPLFAHLRKQNPRLRFVAEQANWASFGSDYLTEGTLDRVFAFRLAGAISSLDKQQLIAAADTTLTMLSPGKEQVVFIENHDMDRFASRVGKDPGKERVGAALNLLLGGIPSIYYGQELGMFGAGGFNKYGNTDANDIPRREAFEWYAADTGKGMALWYKDSGPWWDSTNLKPHDGVSLEEERSDPGSLWNWYRSLLALRKAHPVLETGRYAGWENGNEKIFSWSRVVGSGRIGIAVNLSAETQEATLPARAGGVRLLFGNTVGSSVRAGELVVKLPPYGVGVWEIK